MNPIQAFLTGWRKSFHYRRGKASRSEFFGFVFISILIISGLYGILLYESNLLGREPFGNEVLSINRIPMSLFVIYSMGSALPFISLCSRRLLDAGKSPFLLKLGRIPIIGVIVVSILLCMPSAKQSSVILDSKIRKKAGEFLLEMSSYEGYEDKDINDSEKISFYAMAIGVMSEWSNEQISYALNNPNNLRMIVQEAITIYWENNEQEKFGVFVNLKKHIDGDITQFSRVVDWNMVSNIFMASILTSQ